jgi:hypothetical protein
VIASPSSSKEYAPLVFGILASIKMLCEGQRSMHDEPERRIKAKECEYTFDDKESTFHLVVLLTQGIRLVDVVGRDEKALSASGTTLPKGNMRQAGQ